MDRASLPDLDSLDRDALVELVLAHQEKLTSLIVMRSFAASKPHSSRTGTIDLLARSAKIQPQFYMVKVSLCQEFMVGSLELYGPQPNSLDTPSCWKGARCGRQLALRPGPG
jgi:hypothetical protein